MTTQQLTAIAYGRESQGNVKSVTDQLAIIVAVIAELGWRLAGQYDDSVGASRHSGKARPGWAQLLAELASGEVGALVVWEWSRGTRQLGETATLLDLCRDNGVKIHIVSDDRTYDPTRAADYKHLATAGVDAGYESDRLSERVRRGIGTAARAGRPPQGKAPYGYRRQRVERRNESGELVRNDRGKPIVDVEQLPDPVTAPIVERVYREVAAGHSLAGVARRLDRDGIAPPARRADGGEPAWTRNRIRDLIRNPAYAGLRVHRRQGKNAQGDRRNGGELHPADWPAIVSRELFESAQAAIAGNPAPASSSAIHLLSGIAQCAAGDGGEGHEVSVRRGRYSCRQGCTSVGKRALEGYVVAHVLELLASPQLHAQLRQQGEHTDAKVQAARDQAAALKARLADWRQAAVRGEIDPADFREIADGLRAELAAAEKLASVAGVPPALRAFVDAGADVEARWTAAPLEARRAVIRALARVVVHPVGRRPNVPIDERVTIE